MESAWWNGSQRRGGPLPKYQVMPELTARQYEALRDDIRANGIRHPIEVDENGEVLDGHTRQRIARRLKIDAPQVVIEGLTTDDEKLAYAFRMNVLRRHLSGERREEVFAQLAGAVVRMAESGLTQAKIGEQFGIDQPRISELISTIETDRAYKYRHRRRGR